MKVNKIYNESNLDTMSRMPDNFVDLVVTSPPYDNLRTYEGDSQFDFTATAKSLYRVIKKGGIVVWVIGDQCKDGNTSLTSFRQGIEFQEIGFKMYDVMIYHRLNPMPLTVKYAKGFEYMFVLSKGKVKTANLLKEPSNLAGKNFKARGHRNPDGSYKNSDKPVPGIVKNAKIKSNVWGYYGGSGHSAEHNSPAFEHPAVFPESLAFDHILSWSNRGDLVYDPFMGSGTTAFMCMKTQRDYIGSEISEKYCEIIEKRLHGTRFLDLHY